MPGYFYHEIVGSVGIKVGPILRNYRLITGFEYEPIPKASKWISQGGSELSFNAISPGSQKPASLKSETYAMCFNFLNILL